MKLIAIEALSVPDRGRRTELALSFRSDISILYFHDEALRDAVAAAVSGLLGPSAKDESHRTFPRLVKTVRRPKSLQKWASIRLTATTSHGRALAVTYEADTNFIRTTDVDTGDLLGTDPWRELGLEDPQVLAGVSLLRLSDAQQAHLPEGAARALKKAVFLAKRGSLETSIIDHARLAVVGDASRDVLSISQTLLAREKAAEFALLDSRRKDSELQRLYAEAAMCADRVANLERELSRITYLLLRARHKRLAKRVQRLDDLELQLAKLDSPPPSEAAFSALKIAPEVERILASIGELEHRHKEILKGRGIDAQRAADLVSELEAVERELSLAAYGELLDDSRCKAVEHAYFEWRRLAAEGEAALFAASEARRDAQDVYPSPSERLGSLSKLVTADTLRKLLEEHEAAEGELRAARERKESIAERLRESGLAAADVAEALALRRRVRKSAQEIQGYREAAYEARKTAERVPAIKFLKKRRSERVARAAWAVQSAFLAQEGFFDYDAWKRAVARVDELAPYLDELEEATADAAEAARRLRRAEETIRRRTGGLTPAQAHAVVEELARYQERLAEATEYMREEELARSAAKRLSAAKQAAATQLLVLLRPLGIQEDDPAEAWSKYKLLRSAAQRKPQLESRARQLRSELESSSDAAAQVSEIEAKLQELRRRLEVLLARCGADGNTLDEKLQQFARLREEALLDKKLRQARARLRAQLEIGAEGRHPDEWRKELTAVESELSAIERANPDWSRLEVAAPEAVLEATIQTLEHRLETAAKALQAARRRADAMRSELVDVGSLLTNIESARRSRAKLAWLVTQMERVVVEDEALWMSDTLLRDELPLAAASGTSVHTIPSRPPSAKGGTPAAHGGIEGWAKTAVRRSQPHPGVRAGAGGWASAPIPGALPASPLCAWLLGRVGLALATSIGSDPLPLVVDGVLDVAPIHDKPHLLDVLEAASSGMQVIVLTSDSDVADLAASRGIEVTTQP